jgi:hypothetical protein
MYRVLEGLGEVLDRDLDADERADLQVQLTFVEKHARDSDLARLAGTMKEFLAADDLQTVAPPATWSGRVRQKRTSLEGQWFWRSTVRAVIVGLLLLLAGLALVRLAGLGLAALEPAGLDQFAEDLTNRRGIPATIHTDFLPAWLVLDGIVGLLLLVAASMLALGRERRASRLGERALVFDIALVNILAFYYVQFLAVFLAAFQFGALWIMRYYRRHHVVRR